jgi:ATP-dependent Clp protease ATP-binding subunit ClpB
MEYSGFAAIERTVLKRLDQALRPELVARITEKLVFTRLTFEVQRQICEAMIQKERLRLQKLGHDLVITPSLVEELIREGFHRSLGARPMRNVVELKLQNMVMQRLLN